jgi:hypothetical protein
MSYVNQSLRDHVTSVGFSLQLGKTHIAALVRLDLELLTGKNIHTGAGPQGTVRRMLRNDITAFHGLCARGLVIHVYEDHRHKYEHPDGKRKRGPDGGYPLTPPGDIWNITPAGRLVCDLLKEAGIWHEYADAIGMADGKIRAALNRMRDARFRAETGMSA